MIHFWKNRNSSDGKWRGKIIVLKFLNLFASQCIYSDSSRQAELKYIYLDPQKRFFKTYPLPQTSEISMLQKTSRVSSGNGCNIFGLSNISGLGTCTILGILSCFYFVLLFSSSFSLWWISILTTVDQLKWPLSIP